ncbi:MAG TPA: Ger(x)C family spore germination protein [Candidatus Angelobacter sp.]|nr:Ger(x)C family spore germination protein [Candidatus Angelobacter sp.]
MKKWEPIIGIILFALAVWGGQVPKQIIDDVRLATVTGYDWVDSTHFVGTVEAPNFNPDLTLTQVVYSEVANISKINRRELNAESPYVIVSGKLQATLFNIPLAKHGLINRIDTLYRDPTIGEQIYLAIVDGQAKDLLSKQYEQNLDDGTYLAELIEQNRKQSFLPTTNLHEFSVNYYTKGIDPCLPLLKVVNDKIQIEGVAFFNKDKYVGFVNKNDAVILKMLRENFKSGSIMAKKEHSKKMLDMENISSRKKFKVTYVNGKPHVKVILNVDGIITETYDSKTMSNREMEKLFENQIRRTSKKLLTRFQKVNCDPIGIGYQVSIRNRNWNFEQWKSGYKNVPIQVEVHVKIREKGLIT